MTRQSLILAALVLSCGFSSIAIFAAPAPQRKVTFADAVRIAVDRAPTLVGARSELEIREMELKNSFAAFLPKLDFSAVHGVRDADSSQFDSIYASEMKLELTENLYDNGISLTKYQSAKVQKDIADLSYRDERDKLILAVAVEYLNYSLAANLAAVQEEQFKIINKQYNSVASQFRQGVKTRRDYLRFKTELRRSEIALETARATLEKSRVQLMRLLGFEMNGKTEVLVFEPLELDQALVAKVPDVAPDLALHYQYRVAELKRRVLKNDVDLVRRAYWPEISLAAGASYVTSDYLGTGLAPGDESTTGWEALVTLRFNLLDWGIRRRNLSVAESRRTQAESQITEALNSFAAENAKLLLELKQSSRNYELARDLLDLETKSYSFLDTEFRNGRVNYLEIIDALRGLLSAKVQMFTSYFDLRGQLLRYSYHEGRLYEQIAQK